MYLLNVASERPGGLGPVAHRRAVRADRRAVVDMRDLTVVVGGEHERIGRVGEIGEEQGGEPGDVAGEGLRQEADVRLGDGVEVGLASLVTEQVGEICRVRLGRQRAVRPGEGRGHEALLQIAERVEVRLQLLLLRRGQLAVQALHVSVGRVGHRGAQLLRPHSRRLRRGVVGGGEVPEQRRVGLHRVGDLGQRDPALAVGERRARLGAVVADPQLNAGDRRRGAQVVLDRQELIDRRVGRLERRSNRWCCR